MRFFERNTVGVIGAEQVVHKKYPQIVNMHITDRDKESLQRLRNAFVRLDVFSNRPLSESLLTTSCAGSFDFESVVSQF